MNWEIAEGHLIESEKAYSAIGSSGYFALNHVIRPLRDRYNKGERTQDLYDSIMGISL